MRPAHSAERTINVGALLDHFHQYFLGKHRFVWSLELSVARPPGLEPGTYSLEGCCTIQLCYGRSRAAQSAARRAYYIKQVGRALYKTTNSPNRRLIPVPPLEQRSYHHRQAHRR